MFHLLKNLSNGRYMSSRLILFIDLVASVFATICSLLLLEFATSSTIISFLPRLLWLGGGLISSVVFFYLFRTFNAIIRHSSLVDIGKLFLASVCKGVVLMLIAEHSECVTLSPVLEFVLVFTDTLFTFIILVLLRVLMVVAYDLIRLQLKRKNSREPRHVLVYGPIEKSLALSIRFQNSSTYRVVGLLSSGKLLKDVTVSGLKSYYFETEDEFARLYSRLDLYGVIFATEEAAREEQNRLISYMGKYSVKALIAPRLDAIGEEKHNAKNGVREIKIEDLLGRPEIKISMDKITENFCGKIVMVTGAAGSIGSELVRQLASFGVQKLVLYDNAETPMHNLRLELEEHFPNLDFVPVIGDVRIERRLDFAFRHYRPQVVFHAAAYKHVPLMEENPCEAVLVNAVGSRFVADKCIEYGVEQMVMISTDKAVNPTNIMGCTKRLAEIYVQALGLKTINENKGVKTKFVTTRFGNVLGSNGSVIPRFRDQIAKGGPITVTHPEITRFFMTIPEACRLVMEAAMMTDGNQIFVFDMGESVKIADLAKRMISLAGLEEGKDIKIEYTGLRPGEKLYEEVLSNTENTIPTHHNRISIAKVREYNYDDALALVEELERLSRQVEIPDMVRLMKRAVPEFISKNSVYEKYDKR